jgi:hypothetical protein
MSKYTESSILLPWEFMTETIKAPLFGVIEHSRADTDNWIRAIVYSNGVADMWHVHLWLKGLKSKMFDVSSLEEGKKLADKILIKEGFRLLNENDPLMTLL